MSKNGGRSEIVTREQPLVWDVEPDGWTIVGILEGYRRAMALVRIDMTSGHVRNIGELGRIPVTPDPVGGYQNTLRALRVSPDGKRLTLGYLNAQSDIYMSTARDGLRLP